MKPQVLKLVLVSTVIAVLPALIDTAAATTPIAVDSCAKAFVASLASKYGVAPKMRETQYIDHGLIDAQYNELSLTATNPRNNQLVARATCTFNAQGAVISLQPESAVALRPY